MDFAGHLQSRLDDSKYSFSQKTINVWNILSTDCIHASSVNVFKNRIDKYLVKAKNVSAFTSVCAICPVVQLPKGEPGYVQYCQVF